MAKTKRYSAPKTAPKQMPQPKAASLVLEYKSSAPKRAGFTIDDWRTAMKSAESVDSPSRSKLYDLYNDIALDTHLISVMGKRQDNIRATQWTFSTENGKPNEPIDKLIRSVSFRDALVDMIDARFWGYSACWSDLTGGIFHNYKLLPRKHIIPEKGLFLRQQSDRAGIAYTLPPYSNYIMTAGKTDYLGLLLAAAPWILFKRGDISDWATFNEMYAMPFRKGKYPQYDEVAKKALAEACRDSGSNGYAIVPDTTDLEFIQMQAAGSTDAYERFAMFCDKQISKAFVRNTMTLDAEGGQYKGDIHEESERGVFASDRQFILDILNTRFKELLELHGFAPGDGTFSFVAEDHICLKDRIEIDMKAATKIVIPAHYWYEKYNYPVPEGGPKAIESPAAQLADRLTVMQSEMQSLRATLAEHARLRAEDEQPLAVDPKPRRSGFFG